MYSSYSCAVELRANVVVGVVYLLSYYTHVITVPFAALLLSPHLFSVLRQVVG